jgi:uncharacterized protein YvpB
MRKVSRNLYISGMLLTVTFWLLAGCKARPVADDSNVLSSANKSGDCNPVVNTSNAVSSTSLNELMLRSKNPLCKTKMLRLPLVRQTKGFTCGAASLKSILYYYGDFLAETELQRLLRSHKDNGTSFMRILRFLNALNDKDDREKIMSVYGFDSKIDLSDLELVLNDPAVLAAIKAKAKTSALHASVLQGIEELRDDALDIDKLGSLKAGFSLSGDSADDKIDNGRRVQPQPKRAASPNQNKYALRLFFERKPYNPGGAVPAGCPSTAPAPAIDILGPTRAMTMTDLTQAIDAGHPVLALTQAWSFSNDNDYDIKEYETAWYSGHYVVVVGYDEANIYYMDPYNMGHYAYLPKAEWEKRWHDYDGLLADDGTTRCPGGSELHKFGLVISRAGGPTYDPDRITKMY